MKFFRLRKYSRLRKIALGGNIRESDVDYVHNDNDYESEIIMVLLDEEKAKHDMSKNWKGEYFYSEDESKDAIGYIRYKLDDVETGILIYVDVLEIRSEYRDTRIVGYLLNEFKEQVLDVAIDTVGKENVYVAAEVVNDDLKGFLKRTTDKLGINFDPMGDSFNDLDSDNDYYAEEDNAHSNQERQNNNRAISDKLIDEGFNVVNRSNCVVRNESMEYYIELVDRVNYVSIKNLFGNIENGKVEYTFDNSFTPNSNVVFNYDIINNVLNFDCELSQFVESNKNNGLEIRDNAEDVFPPHATVTFLNNNDSLSVEQLLFDIL